MINNLSYVMTLANGVIGVSVLAMPFCFKQCGIVLSILMLVLSSILSKFACHLLVKSAVMSRRRNFEILAFHAFGRTGKLFAELFIIGFLMGTCIAFFVVVGDLGPEIIGKMIDKSPADIRTSLLVTIAVFVVLPLGLLRNVDSLSSICTATIGFYLCLVLKVMTESMTHIFATDWYDKVFYWRPSGILQCIPIFSMALFCQTQLFEIYETIPNVCLDKMNQVVHVALNICTVVYVCVGFFGYIAFCTLPFTGNILMSFEPSLSSEVIKIGFVISVAFSFPLVIFPCRASLHSLLFRWTHSYETASNYIPETRFRWLTFMIVAASLVTGILIPNIELVLGLVGSTIGVMICLMFPAAFFISISSKNTNERLVAQAMLFIGVWIMILGTYANLYAMEESANAKVTVTSGDSLNQLNNVPIELINPEDVQVDPPIPKINEIPNIDDTKFIPLAVEKTQQNTDVKDDIRQEPPIPVERAVVNEKVILETKKPESHLIQTLSPAIEEIVQEIDKLDKNLVEKPDKEKQKQWVDKNEAGKEESLVLKAEDKVENLDTKEKRNAAIHKADNSINSDAIRKEETELAEAAKLAEAEHDKKHEELRRTLEKYSREQRQMMKEQKEIMNTLKQQKEELEKEKKEKNASKKTGKKAERGSKDNIDEPVEPNKNNLGNNESNDINNRLAGAKPLAKEQDAKARNEPPQTIVQNKFKDNETIKQETRIDDEKRQGDPGLVEAKDKTIKKSRGPILSALAKQAANSSTVSDVQADVNRKGINLPNLTSFNLAVNQKIESDAKSVKPGGVNLSNDNVQPTNNNNAPVPIALVMGDKTKKSNVKPTSAKKTDGKLTVGRDILENLERRKRDIDGIGVEEDRRTKNGLLVVLADEMGDNLKTGNVKSFVSDVALGADSKQKCAKTDEISSNVNINGPAVKLGEKRENDEKNVREKVTTELLLIKTNSYLSNQNFANPNSLNKDFDLKTNFQKSNQRDLKPVSSKDSNSK